MAEPEREAGVLDRILADKRAHALYRGVSLGEMRRRAEACARTPDPRVLLGRRPQLMAIAEFKRRSPSAGWLRPDGDAAQVARGYAEAGACMVSVLTDRSYFGGSLDDLQEVTSAGIPALRKDFLLDEYDLYEARAAGACCALLIARVLLDDGLLGGLICLAGSLGMGVLVEAHSLAEAERALRLGATLIGINHRDLSTLRVDLSLSEGLRARLGDEVVLVAESGLRTSLDLALMRERGMDAVLIGEALMREDSPGEALARLLGGLEGRG